MDEKIREKLVLTNEEARQIIWEDEDKFEIIQDNVIENSRWSIIHDIVIKRKIDGKFFRDTYSRGATESQDEMPYEYSEPNFEEVFPVEKIIISYE